MKERLRQYLRIALLAGRPQDLPGGSEAMLFAVVLSLVTYLLAVAPLRGLASAIGFALFDLGFAAAVLYAGLMLVARTARFPQAYGALCGAGAILNLAAIPLFQWLVSDAAGSGTASPAYVLQMLHLVWSLAVIAHVIRHTFEVRMGTSVLLAFAFVALQMSVVAGVFPDSLDDARDSPPSSQSNSR